MMTESITIFGFAGSLRKNSYNKALLRAAIELLPEDVKLEIFDLDGIPPFNQDLEKQPPDRVKEFKERIRAADAILISTPEYNNSMSGVLKNAMDWASRPSGDNSFDGKPVAIMSASTGMIGGARAQMHLKQIISYLNMHLVNKPEVLVTFARQKFDENGALKDEAAKGFMRELIQNLVTWTRKLKEK